MRVVRECERNNNADTRVSEEGEGEDDPSAEIPLQPLEKTVVKQAIPLEDHARTDVDTAAHTGFHAEAVSW